jgi:hypothetical protein
MADMAPTAGRVWKRMTFDQRHRAALAFWRDETTAAEQAQAVQLIAKQMKFRPKTIAGLGAEGKARHLANVPLPDDLATRLLVLYHLAEQRPMMAAFLDALGIAHENGLIRDGSHVTPDPAKLGPAVAALANAYPAADVAIYLDTLFCHDAETWGGLRGLPDMPA